MERAIRGVRDVEIEHLRTQLQLLRSHFSEELHKPVKKVFKEKLPNLSVVNDERNKNIEVKWKENEGCNDEMDFHASLLERLTIATIPRLQGFDYSVSAGTFEFQKCPKLSL